MKLVRGLVLAAIAVTAANASSSNNLRSADSNSLDSSTKSYYDSLFDSPADDQTSEQKLIGGSTYDAFKADSRKDDLAWLVEDGKTAKGDKSDYDAFKTDSAKDDLAWLFGDSKTDNIGAKEGKSDFDALKTDSVKEDLAWLFGDSKTDTIGIKGGKSDYGAFKTDSDKEDLAWLFGDSKTDTIGTKGGKSDYDALKTDSVKDDLAWLFGETGNVGAKRSKSDLMLNDIAWKGGASDLKLDDTIHDLLSGIGGESDPCVGLFDNKDLSLFNDEKFGPGNPQVPDEISSTAFSSDLGLPNILQALGGIETEKRLNDDEFKDFNQIKDTMKGSSPESSHSLQDGLLNDLPENQSKPLGWTGESSRIKDELLPMNAYSSPTTKTSNPIMTDVISSTLLLILDDSQRTVDNQGIKIDDGLNVNDPNQLKGPATKRSVPYVTESALSGDILLQLKSDMGENSPLQLE